MPDAGDHAGFIGAAVEEPQLDRSPAAVDVFTLARDRGTSEAGTSLLGRPPNTAEKPAL